MGGCGGKTKEANGSGKKDNADDNANSNGQIDPNVNESAKKLTLEQVDEKRKQLHDQLNQGEFNVPKLHIPKFQPITTQ